MKTLYAIYKKNGSINYDIKDGTPVFYLTRNPGLLFSHVDNDEVIRPISKKVFKRTWVLKDLDGKPLQVKKGVMLATTSRKYAKTLVKDCKLTVIPSTIG